MLPDKAVKGHRVDSFTPVWQYDDLVVENDFLISKTSAEIRTERERIRKDAPIFFESRPQEKELKLKNLEQVRFGNPVLYNRIKPLFDSIYGRGVIESVPEEERNKTLFVSDGNYAEQSMYSNFFTLQSALAYLESELGDLQSDLNFLDFLTVTHFYSAVRTEMFLNSRLDQLSFYKPLPTTNVFSSTVIFTLKIRKLVFHGFVFLRGGSSALSSVWSYSCS